jgi:hypothetical protein
MFLLCMVACTTMFHSSSNPSRILF